MNELEYLRECYADLFLDEDQDLWPDDCLAEEVGE